jgi:hypothetical protein
MLGTRKSLALAITLAMSGVAAACGPSAPPPETPADQSQTGTAVVGDKSDAVTPPTSTEPPGTPPGTAPDPGGASAPSVRKGEGSKKIKESKMLDEVKKIGVNLKTIPDLEKLPLAQKKKLMPLFQKALGYASCTSNCHVEGDYKRETRDMKITRGMWKHYVAEIRDEKGANLFCDSCHDGTAKNLDRSDRKALEKFMEEEYVQKITRADKKDVECSTCHGDTMENKIIANLWGIK